MTNKIKFFWNGFKLNGENKLVRCFYSLNDNGQDAPAVSIMIRDYSGRLPRDLFDVVNETDVYTDYFDDDSATLTPEHPLYPFARYAAEKARNRDQAKYIERLEKSLQGREVWPGQFAGYREDIHRRRGWMASFAAMKDPGQPSAQVVEEARDYIQSRREAAQAARIARQEAEDKARAEAVETCRREGGDFIRKTAAEFPLMEGEPEVVIRWSEFPAFYDWEDDALILSVAAADIIFRHFDTRETKERHGGGYFKTAFVIRWTDETGEGKTYEGRYDLGDLEGGLVEHIRAFGLWQLEHDAFGHAVERTEEENELTRFAGFLEGFTAGAKVRGVSWAPWLVEAAERTAKGRAEAPDGDAGGDFDIFEAV